MYAKIKEPLPVVAMTVVGFPIDVGAEASKKMPPGSRYRYRQPVVYVREDGEQIESAIGALTKPKLASRIADHFRYIENRMMFADQWDNDGVPHWSTSIHFSIG